MRQVFTSPRLENVEAVAAMLREAGIEVKITNERSYRGNRRSNFSYRERDDDAPQPAVWIVHADDQPRGRQLLRDAGLLESSRAGESSYLPLSVLRDDKADAATGKARRAMRIKLGLLALIAAVIAMIFFAARKPTPAADPPSAAPAVAAPAASVVVPQSVEDLQDYRAPVPSALAKLLVDAQLSARAPAQACIAIDGNDPAPALMQSLAAGKAALFPASACPGDAAFEIAVHDYLTDGSGHGTVQLALDGGAARTLEVERDGLRWRILSRR